MKAGAHAPVISRLEILKRKKNYYAGYESWRARTGDIMLWSYLKKKNSPAVKAGAHALVISRFVATQKKKTYYTGYESRRARTGDITLWRY